MSCYRVECLVCGLPHLCPPAVGSPLYRRPILIQDFPQHVKELHMDVDRGMEDEYTVRCVFLGIPRTVDLSTLVIFVFCKAKLLCVNLSVV